MPSNLFCCGHPCTLTSSRRLGFQDCISKGPFYPCCRNEFIQPRKTLIMFQGFEYFIWFLFSKLSTCRSFVIPYSKKNMKEEAQRDARVSFQSTHNLFQTPPCLYRLDLSCWAFRPGPWTSVYQSRTAMHQRPSKFLSAQCSGRITEPVPIALWPTFFNGIRITITQNEFFFNTESPLLNIRCPQWLSEMLTCYRRAKPHRTCKICHCPRHSAVGETSIAIFLDFSNFQIQSMVSQKCA